MDSDEIEKAVEDHGLRVVEHLTVYRDGSDVIVVEGGMPGSGSARVGFGDSLTEATDGLQSTPIEAHRAEMVPGYLQSSGQIDDEDALEDVTPTSDEITEAVTEHAVDLVLKAMPDEGAWVGWDFPHDPGGHGIVNESGPQSDWDAWERERRDQLDADDFDGGRDMSPQELEEAIELLGATIDVRAGQENITITGTTLSRNYNETIDLLEEIILEPRWDEDEFDLAVQRVISQIQQQEANPNSVAQNSFNALIYGEDNIKSKSILGSIKSVERITMDDLKAYYSSFLSPSISRMHIVGAMDKSSVLNSLQDLDDHWESKDVTIPVPTVPGAPGQSQVFFYDIPDAKQSVLRIGYPALSAMDEDYYEAILANYILGGGGFASRLTQELREGKGYTYSIRSYFIGTETKGPFVISSGVRSNVTLESAELVKQILENYPETFSEEDLETTRSFLVKSNARAFETADAKLDMLQNISAYGWPYDYLKIRAEIVEGMTVDRIKELSERYFNAERMFWLVVGDARTQLDRMQDLGFGAPILINHTSGNEQSRLAK